MQKDTEKEFLKAYDDYADAIFRFCYFKTKDRELSKDLLQEVFLKVWAYISDGKVIQNFRPFLYRTADNMIIDWYRKKKTLSLDALAEDGFDPVDVMAQTETYAEVEEAMNMVSRLEERDQSVILMRYVDGLSPKEIAVILGEKENSISVRLHRALKRLQDLIQ